MALALPKKSFYKELGKIKALDYSKPLRWKKFKIKITSLQKVYYWHYGIMIA